MALPHGSRGDFSQQEGLHTQTHKVLFTSEGTLNVFLLISPLSLHILHHLGDLTSSSDFRSMLVLQLWSNKKIVELRAESWVSLMFSDSGDLWSSSDTSRCVAEKKYTEQQAKKLFPQVFVPVCNPDGTYSEVTGKPLN